MPRHAEDSKSLSADLVAGIARLVTAARAEGREEALAQVRHLVAGGGEIPVPKRRGRPLGSKNKPKTVVAARSGKKRKNPWTGLSAEARLAKVNALRKGRGLAPKATL